MPKKESLPSAVYRGRLAAIARSESPSVEKTKEVTSLFRTRITEMLGIKYPILEGGMVRVGTGELAAAVANTGCFGMISSHDYPSRELLKAEIKKARSLTDKPFGINVGFWPTISTLDRGELIDTALEEGIKVIETSGHIVEDDVKRIRKGKVIHIHKVARLRDARSAERLGVDAVTIVGYECGGGSPMEEITTMIQVPQVVDAVKIPVLAGGGIGDARGFVAALSLGASGVVMGTRFMMTRDSMVHQSIKEKLVKAEAADTVLIQRSIRVGERVVKNERAEKILAMEQRGAKLEELLPFLVGGEIARRAWDEGNFDTLVPCGQVIGLINDIPTVKEVVDNIVKGAQEIIKGLSSLAAADKRK